jgi:hypothetical protein
MFAVTGARAQRETAILAMAKQALPTVPTERL